MKTIKESINDLRNELETTEIHPTRACQIAVRLSAYWANINEQLVEREMIYNNYLADIMRHVIVVSKAKVFAQSSEQYKNVIEYQSLSKSVVMMIRSLNRLVRRKELEASTSRYG